MEKEREIIASKEMKVPMKAITLIIIMLSSLKTKEISKIVLICSILLRNCRENLKSKQNSKKKSKNL